MIVFRFIPGWVMRFFLFLYFMQLHISSISMSVHKAKLTEVLNDGLWRTKFCQQYTSACGWLLFKHFKQGFIFLNRSPWPLFVFESGVIFLEMSEPVLCHTFVKSPWALHIINFFCHCPCTQSFFSTSWVKWYKLQFFHYSWSKV